jgi:NADPH:quinone reductase-like Zn-dependent oxidoreductase
MALPDLIESEKIALAVDRTYPLSKTAAAIRYMQDGHAQGKVVINV